MKEGKGGSGGDGMRQVKIGMHLTMAGGRGRGKEHVNESVIVHGKRIGNESTLNSKAGISRIMKEIGQSKRKTMETGASLKWCIVILIGGRMYCSVKGESPRIFQYAGILDSRVQTQEHFPLI